MSGIAGLLRLDGAPVSRPQVERLVRAQGPRATAGARIHVSGNVGIAQLWSRIDPGEAVGRRGAVAVGDVRIDNRSELAAELGAGPDASDLRLVVEGFERWGSSTPERLYGDFAVAIWDPVERRLLCFRDRFGTKPLVVRPSPGRFAFASQPAGVLDVDGTRAVVDERSIAAFLVDEIPDETTTFFHGIERLPPGHLMEISAEVPSSPGRRYWSLEAVAPAPVAADAVVEARFLDLLTDAVRTRLRDADPIGVALSGGVDSSTIACIAAGIVTPGLSARTYTLGTTDPRVDERPFVDAVLAAGRFEPVFLPDTDVIDGVQDRVSEISIDSPYAAIGALIDGTLYRRAAADGTHVILDGIDGDTVVSHGLARLTDLAREGHLVTLLRESRALSHRLDWTWLGTIRAEALGGAPNLRRQRPDRYAGSLIDRAFAERVQLDAWLDAAPKQPPSRPFARGEHLLDLTSPVNALALETLEHTAVQAGVEVRHPFFEARLAEFCLALPADQKLRNGWPRSILRRSTAGVVPDAVRWRSDKAVLAPAIVGRCAARIWPEITELVRNKGGLASGYVDPRRLGRAYERASGGSGVDAGLLWEVFLLDRWLRRAT